MPKILQYSELSIQLIEQYKNSVKAAFPEVIFKSEVVKTSWRIIEQYFPEYQLFYIDDSNNMIGFINTIPIRWNKPFNELPEDGWDWLVRRGIEGYEQGIKPNCLGGLQIIVCNEHLGKGISKTLIQEGKKIMETKGIEHYILPIRPTLKHRYPNLKMKDYLDFKKDHKIYDPWIRTHLNNGAEIIKVCSNSMNISGPIALWESLAKRKIDNSGPYVIEGALNPVMMDIENNFGEYREENIWIKYSLKNSH